MSKNNKFELLKQTYPKSKKDRDCDGYKFIIENTTPNQRKELGIFDDDLQQKIVKGEVYLYRVGKENKKFKTMYISLKNFEIIRKYYFIFSDE